MPNEPEVDSKIILKLSSKQASERDEAQEALEALGPEAVDALIAVLQKEAVSYRKRRTMAYVGLAAFVVVMIVLAVLQSDNVAFITTFTSFMTFATASQLQKNAAKKLAEYDDVRIVGHLAAQLDVQDGDLRKQVVPRLTQLLPRLRASDSVYITPEQHAALTRVLKRPNLKKESAFVEAVVRAMEQIGTEEDVEPVRRLASENGPAARYPAIREAARAERLREANTLLRAASAPESPSETLLRPASGSADVDSSNLLRPASTTVTQQDSVDPLHEQPLRQVAD
jgi:HEAT repeat protein